MEKAPTQVSPTNLSGQSHKNRAVKRGRGSCAQQTSSYTAVSQSTASSRTVQELTCMCIPVHARLMCMHTQMTFSSHSIGSALHSKKPHFRAGKWDHDDTQQSNQVAAKHHHYLRSGLLASTHCCVSRGDRLKACSQCPPAQK